jgi:hypothetical protein
MQLSDAALSRTAHTADVDGDGDVDLITASERIICTVRCYPRDEFAWYENTDGKGTFKNERMISDPVGGPRSINTADVDRDGDLDLLVASHFTNRVGPGVTNRFSAISWYENMDGKGAFGPRRDIASVNEDLAVNSAYAADVDGDGDLDVLGSASPNSLFLAWYENTDGKGSFTPQIVALGNDLFAYPADVDGDGDVDVLSAFRREWFENIDGKGSFVPRVIENKRDRADHVSAGDVDGDGDVDAIFAYRYQNRIVWYPNTDGKANFGDRRLITSASIGVSSVYPVDMDGDDDVDMLASPSVDGKIFWYENTDGQGTFGNQRVVNSLADSALDVNPADVDGDGDTDVFSASSTKVTWYENLSPPRRLVGDSNGDGVFNSSDLVFVFQAGKYEDGIARNATFEEGDWNGDGDFDSSDLVLAFQEGNYVAEARPTPDRIAAAVDSFFATDQERHKPHQLVINLQEV